MGWRIIEINTDDHISLYLNNLLIKKDDKKIVININDIDILMLDNYKLSLTVQLINAITRNNGLIITFDNQHQPASFIYAINGHYNSLKILESQINWGNEYKGKLWQEIVRNKINNQFQHCLTIRNEAIDDQWFNKAIYQVEAFDLTNREGHVAKVYWHLLFGFEFTRDYSGEKFPLINGMLNYGYAILRGLVIKSIVKKGLDPRIAIFHKSFNNFFALASDFMEPFRIIVDKVVFENKDALFFSLEMKQKLVRCLTEKVWFDNKVEYINNAIDKAIEHVIKGKGWLWVDIWKSS